MTAIRLVLLDIEGTTLPVSFVHDVLFPYAAKALPGLVDERKDDPKVKVALEDIEREFPGSSPLDVMREWMAKDIKAAPLKTLQGIAWDGGFRDGTLHATLYPDVAPVLRAWHDAGLRLAVYSSGSANAQRLLYGYTTEGDMTSLFEAFYDLDIGSKKVAESYTEIAERAGVTAGEILFLSDIGAELDAARFGGYQICQLVRPQDGTQPVNDVPHAADLHEVSSLFGLTDA